VSNRNEEEFDLSGWGRLVLGVLGVLIGLAMVGGGVQFTDWWINGVEDTVTSVSCDYDDDDDLYYPEDGRSVERFQDETGAWCARTTTPLETYATTDWPLWLAAPAWVIALLLMVALCIGGLVLAFCTVMLTCDSVMRKGFLQWCVLTREARAAVKR
jgi:hypothetical protein